MSRKLYNILIAIFAIIFLISAFMVGNYLIEGKEQEDRYNELAQCAEHFR